MIESKLIEEITSQLGDNFISGDEEIIKNFLNRYTQIASNTSHRESDDEKLVPYVVNAVVQSYLRRGKEASSSNNEGGMSDSFIDIEDKLKKDILSIRIML